MITMTISCARCGMIVIVMPMVLAFTDYFQYQLKTPVMRTVSLIN